MKTATVTTSQQTNAEQALRDTIAGMDALSQDALNRIGAMARGGLVLLESKRCKLRIEDVAQLLTMISQTANTYVDNINQEAVDAGAGHLNVDAAARRAAWASAQTASQNAAAAPQGETSSI